MPFSLWLVWSQGEISRFAFDQLLTGAIFEEAKFREIGATTPQSVVKRDCGSFNRPIEKGRYQESERSDRGVQCYNCGGTGHIARQYPMKGQVAPREAPGNTKHMANAGTHGGIPHQ